MLPRSALGVRSSPPGMGLWPLVSSGSGRMVASVTTMEADLEKIEIEADWTGRELFDTVCRIIGLREIWFFGLQFSNKHNLPCWLQMDKKIAKQEVPRQKDGVLHFLFLVKFYPETVEDELIQDLTRHLFFLQLKQAILSGELYCQPEASVLLASFALQAEYGDCPELIDVKLETILPHQVITQFDLSESLWWDRLRKWWRKNLGLAREEAELEYLRVAQDLDMYGTQYYQIRNKRKAPLLLGVSALGVGVYERDNRVNPITFFPWNEITNIYFKNKKFSLKTAEKEEVSFHAEYSSINMSILDLCVGTHNLFLRRRQPELLEVQQMRAQAAEQRLRRKEEQDRRAEEREERERLREKLEAKEDELEQAMMAIQRTEERLKSLEEAAATGNHVVATLSKKASDAEAELIRMKQSQRQLEEVMRAERKERELELYSQRLQPKLNDSRRPQYASHLVLADTSWPTRMPLPLQGTLSYHQLMQSSSTNHDDGGDVNGNQFKSIQGMTTPSMLSPPALPTQPPPPDPSAGQFMMPSDLQMLKSNLEMTRKQYNERSRNLKDRLAGFRSQIESLKRDDYIPTENDVGHAQNVANGCFDRLSTLRMSSRGTTKSRIQQLDSK